MQGIRLNIENCNSSQYHILRHIVCLGTVTVNTTHLRLRKISKLRIFFFSFPYLEFLILSCYFCLGNFLRSWNKLEPGGCCV